MQYFLPSLQTKPYVHFLLWEVERKWGSTWCKTAQNVIIMYRQTKGSIGYEPGMLIIIIF